MREQREEQQEQEQLGTTEKAFASLTNQPQEPGLKGEGMMRPVHGYAGAEWLKRGGVTHLSPLGVVVADILGLVYGGLYHLPESAIARPDWTSPNGIWVVVPDGIATHDGSQLTTIVLLAHACCVRVQINQGGPRGLKILFSRRDRSDDGMQNHPTIDTAIARFHDRVTFVAVGAA